MVENWKEELQSGGSGWFNPKKELQADQSMEIVVVGHERIVQGSPGTERMKYFIQPKDGSTPYLWRFRLQDGRTWDVQNSARKNLLAGLHPDNSEDVVPARFRITNVGRVVNKQPSVRVEYLGKAEVGARGDDGEIPI